MIIQIEDPDEKTIEIEEFAGEFSFILEQEVVVTTALIEVGSLGISNLNRAWTKKLSDIYEKKFQTLNFRFKRIDKEANQAIFDLLLPYLGNRLEGLNFPNKKSRNDYFRSKLSKMIDKFLNQVNKLLGKPLKIWQLVKRNSNKEYNFFTLYYSIPINEIFLVYNSHILMVQVGV